ncbi:phosphatidylserine decarboxylase proenzyme 3-like [Hibiscus syriacus]|uniref:Phosphatidylserine decarboxylase proenzyme 3-like n=1 Tax=Hibiscus syriacus TaxID=106335 RepID=A0A6A3BMZ1_HIBSY|nr:NAC domain-containing protein 104-like [Hibiscus syriacus]KAE8716798.1 phosphatidylserine decarboxylase proenzyme 3-like [Hibiscus syriacus]
MGDNRNVNLPPGFIFCPTDEELVVHFLQRKVSLLPCHPDVIPDLELYPCDPWELDGKALGEGKQWYFYSRKTQNRSTGNGYWKPMGSDEPVVNSDGGQKVGMKKHFIFYIGESGPAGIKTNWIMQEYRLSDPDSGSSRSSNRRGGGHSNIDYSKWVVCRVYERSEEEEEDDGTELSCLDEVFLSLDDLEDISLPN